MSGGDLRTTAKVGVLPLKFLDEGFQLVPLQSQSSDLRLQIVDGGLHASAAQVGEFFRQFLGVGKRVVAFRERDDGDVLLLLVLIGKKGLREVARKQGIARS